MPVTTTQQFTDRLWEAIGDIYPRILEHPFLEELIAGTLDEEAFKHYIVQDTLYIREYGRAHCIAAGRAETGDDMLQVCEMAADIVRAEQAFHADFFREWGISDEELWSTPLAPTTLAYTSYLTSVAYSGTFPEVIGAVLPCAVIYFEVGKTLAERGSERELYQRWIDLYSGAEYEATIQGMLAIANRLGPALGEAEQRRVERHFVTASRLEWMFWDMGYRREQWPV